MLLFNNIKLPLDTDFNNLKPIICQKLKLDLSLVKRVRLYRKSVDARRKSDVHFCCSVLIETAVNEERLLKSFKNAVKYAEKDYQWQKTDKILKNRPIVVGFGPAGMFCGLALAKAGLKPLIIERGSRVEERTKAVEDFFSGKPINTESNIQFGEGGAGTFSDGKLTTGIKNPRSRTVLKVLNQMGAGANILTDAKPHIGTDILKNVVRNIRNEILSLGGEILFNTRLDNIEYSEGKITKIITNKGEFPCDFLVLATGHSARDTYRMINRHNISMVQKPFAVGVRIEHLQEDINKALYGEFHNHPSLGSADYKLACHLENGRGVYTFCMCPGGEVVNASSENNALAVNGMSNSARDGKNANSAILVGIEPRDFGSDDVLAGCELQEKIEKNAYRVGNGKMPITTVGNLLSGDEFKITKVRPTVKPVTAFCDFYKIFPDYIVNSLKDGIKEFGKKINGFDDAAAILTAPETRSSAPVRILRNEALQSDTLQGLYPCGEGAGYAGGIVSAAVDGIMVAEAILNQINNS